jgi:glycosyltransferase involved in cell wall biosynthesis
VRPLRVLYEQLALPRRARHDHIDVLFSTGNYRPLGYNAPNVVALHAVQHFLLDGEIGRMRQAYLKFAVPRSVRSADLVVAVTETLRRDAIALFDLDPDRIVTVHMGPSPWVLELVEDAGQVEPYRTEDESPYVLCISRLYALKNHRRLIEAFSELVQTDDLPHKLVIAGADADVTRTELMSLAQREGIPDRVVMLGRVPQATVPALYMGASAVAYVSLYETFGHPVLEALATGRPLVTSKTGASSEVAGGAARIVDPWDVHDIAAGLSDVLGDATLREQLVAKGRRRLGDFSWEKCGRETVDALERAFSRRGGAST